MPRAIRIRARLQARQCPAKIESGFSRWHDPSLICVFLLVLGLAGCAVRQPSSLETSFVQGVKRNVTVRGRDDHNPLPATRENIYAGQANFSNYCMVCHGLDGQNTGVPFAARMSPPVPDLGSKAVQAYSDGQLKWIIDNGIFPSGMPASKGTLNDDEIWQIVHYIRHLPAKGTLGEPAVYGGAATLGQRVGLPSLKSP